MRTVRVASISFRRGNDVAATLQQALALVNQAGEAQPDIIVLPENCINSRETAETVPGPITAAMAERARELNCHIIIPLMQKADDGTLRNVAVLIDPQGAIVGLYQKMFPTDYEMASGVMPGTETPVFATPVGRIGMAICFDLNFSEVITGLAEAGAEIVFFVSAYEGGRQLHRWALDYGVYIVSAHREGYGYIIDKSGYILQKGDPVYGPIVVRDLNLERKILHLDYNWRKLRDVVARYGKGVHIDIYRPEAICALESRSPDLTVDAIMAEFGLESYSGYLARSRRLRLAKLRGESITPGPV
jgi:predicted amidohydrolase